MRPMLLTLILAVPVLAVIAILLLNLQAKRFLQAVPDLRTIDDLVPYRRLAKGQMYVALVMMRALWLPLLIWLAGHFYWGDLGWLDLLLFVILPWIVVVVTGMSTSGPVERVHKLPAATPDLEAQRDHVVDVWLHKNFPDW